MSGPNATTATTAPRWDLSPFFPGIGSRELHAAMEEVQIGVARVRHLYDQHDVRCGDARPPGAAEVAALEWVLPATNELLERMRLVGAYLHAHTTTDARDAEAARLQSRLQSLSAEVGPLTKRLEAWVASVGADALIAASSIAADHAFMLRRAEQAAGHQMSEDEEFLASELSLTGGRSWARLHSEVTATLTADVPLGEGADSTRLPMSEVRALASHADGQVRRAAFEAEVEAWRSVEVPLAIGLSSFKGEANVLGRRRGWEDSLDVALFTNNVTPGVLAAMQAAVVDSLDDFGRFNRAKARALRSVDGADRRSGLPWWDLLAPVGTPQRFTWPEAVGAVEGAFTSFAPGLAELARRATGEGWIDAEPRPGKVGGAFCMPVRDGVSRVLCNFDGSFDSVQTLAHELGHAYHNVQLGPRTPLQKRTPMALAETASIFCETIVVQAGLAAAADDQARLAILDGDLVGAAQVVVDIHSRFLFERAITAERDRGVIGPARFRELMVEAQLAAYRDGLDPDHPHPYMWAVKGHYYTAYYNWPYTFGLLFGIGLYAAFRADPDRFRGTYDDLLSSTGLGDASELAARFGIDIADVGFWTASLDVLRGRIDTYIALVDA